MQRSIDEFNKKGKRPALTAHKANQTNGEQKKKSSKLVGILNSHLTKTKRYASSTAQHNDNAPTSQNTTHLSTIRDQGSPPQQLILATCPICLKKMPADTYDNHMQQERQNLLTSRDDDKERLEQQEEVEIIIQRKKRRKADVNFLKTNPQQQQRQHIPSAPPQFNHYRDQYSGEPIIAPEADDVGLEGAPQRLAWEGAGFTELM